MINVQTTFINQSEFDESEQDKAGAIFLYQTVHVHLDLIADEFPLTYASKTGWCRDVIVSP